MPTRPLMNRYGLFSVFFRSVPPPTVHIHMRLYSNLASGTVPSLTTKASSDVLASSEESRAFELWLRELWTQKEARMTDFYRDHAFTGQDGDSASIPIRQL